MDFRCLMGAPASAHGPLHHHDVSPVDQIEAQLHNGELWRRFSNCETEMIITKGGRRMFPNLQVEFRGMDSHAHYCVFVEFAKLGESRYKYAPSTGWSPSGSAEAQSSRRIYMHPDSPSTGEQWMAQFVSFGKAKLTNTAAPPVGHVVLSSMHKYQPRILILMSKDPDALQWSPVKVISFTETQFIAVTAYQNEKITKLKINFNPFAKGFRENGKSTKRKANQPAEICPFKQTRPSSGVTEAPTLSPTSLHCSPPSSRSSASPALHPLPLSPLGTRLPPPSMLHTQIPPFYYPYPPYPVYYNQPWWPPVMYGRDPRLSYLYPQYPQYPQYPPTLVRISPQEPQRQLSDFSIESILKPNEAAESSDSS